MKNKKLLLVFALAVVVAAAVVSSALAANPLADVTAVYEGGDPTRERGAVIVEGTVPTACWQAYAKTKIDKTKAVITVYRKNTCGFPPPAFAGRYEKAYKLVLTSPKFAGREIWVNGRYWFTMSK